MNDSTKARLKKITDEAYAVVRNAGHLESCVGLGVVVKDAIDTGQDPLAIAARAERSAVLMVARIIEELQP